MSYTAEQEKVVLEVLEHDKHAFYEILRIEKGSSEVEIKKAYRKLAIKLHPDKNPYPRAHEAFKLINRAFEVLGDPQKRNVYDQIGRDPDDRAAAAAAGPGMGSGMGMGRGQGFDEFNPFQQFFQQQQQGAFQQEDIFDFLFSGGSPFGSPFGGSPFGPQASFSFGGPGGFRVYTNQNGFRRRGGFRDPMAAAQEARRRRAANHRGRTENEMAQTEFRDMIRILAPFLLLLLLPMLERMIFG
ncbi:type I HSP40 co-chaperone HLJ1 [Nakaseomyces bracarensis]|uniref:type I HSP40 co-chaperone HLJ1 n=1 Tax=Nakaseomyces bracarensis TaxID=273131 RepID=UPI003871CC1D